MGDIERDMYRERYINGDREITREKEGGGSWRDREIDSDR